MKTELNGVYVLEPRKIRDGRGFFARSWDKKEFEEIDSDFQIVQVIFHLINKKALFADCITKYFLLKKTKLIR
ncbi:MAG: dTDP-4-keto-6-deoxy-D-glucose epimerase [Flammeovirgaceae bacterium]|nr:dTDP-4-keto-6-deoxy-D-glucose epimerase [Flammeovirgaceae bacterium]